VVKVRSGGAAVLEGENWATILRPLEPVAPDEAVDGAGDLTAMVCPPTGLPISPGRTASEHATLTLAAAGDPFTRPTKV
jgi:hypothetical protein